MSWRKPIVMSCAQRQQRPAPIRGHFIASSMSSSQPKVSSSMPNSPRFDGGTFAHASCANRSHSAHSSRSCGSDTERCQLRKHGGQTGRSPCSRSMNKTNEPGRSFAGVGCLSRDNSADVTTQVSDSPGRERALCPFALAASTPPLPASAAARQSPTAGRTGRARTGRHPSASRRTHHAPS